MTNNTPDYEDNLYFEDYVSGIKVEKSDKITDCKNCKYTDEYCASGDCNKIQANDLACNKISLTEQWKKGELPEGHYYVKDGENMIAEYLDEYFYNNGEPMTSFSGGVEEVLDKVPSYEEWQAKLEENALLKELLKDCRLAVFDYPPFDLASDKIRLTNKIEDVLK